MSQTRKVPCSCQQRAYDELFGPDWKDTFVVAKGKKRNRHNAYIQRDYECFQRHGVHRLEDEYEPT